MTAAREKGTLHLGCSYEDFVGNNGAGRYLFLTGCAQRARLIAERFDGDPVLRASDRGHHLYTGEVTQGGVRIDIGSISTGMGAPSIDIIMNELLSLGAKKFLRMGTCGLLQSQFMKGGDIAVATSAVRDEGTTDCYVPKEFPAVASFEMIQAITQSVEQLHLESRCHFGIFHTKSSLYAREFNQSMMKEENARYMQIMKDAGVIASEMETAVLLTLASLAHGRKDSRPISPSDSVMAGSICAVLGEGDDFGSDDLRQRAVNEAINLGMATYFSLHSRIHRAK
jgi:uridine phosphorylase